MNKRTVGKEYEDKAAIFLEQQGYTILQRNYHCRFAELDLIARENGCLCFIEVKYRKNANFEAPFGVITADKIRKNCQAALFYLKENRIPLETPIRFDVAMIIGNKIKIYKNAFDFQF